MSEPTVVAKVPAKVVSVGGDQHSGWLPANAITPLDLPIREVTLSIEVQFDGSGYLLCYSSIDGTLFGDTWHESQTEAELVAQEDFGVEFEEWCRNA